MSIQPHPELGEELHQAYSTALEDWLKYNRRGQDPEVALAGEVRSIELTAHLRSRRNGLVTVSIYTRRKFDDAVYPFQLQMTPFSAYRQSRTQ